MTQISLDLTKTLAPPRDAPAPNDTSGAGDGTPFADQLQDATDEQLRTPEPREDSAPTSAETSGDAESTAEANTEEQADTQGESPQPESGESEDASDESASVAAVTVEVKPADESATAVEATGPEGESAIDASQSSEDAAEGEGDRSTPIDDLAADSPLEGETAQQTTEEAAPVVDAAADADGDAEGEFAPEEAIAEIESFGDASDAGDAETGAESPAEESEAPATESADDATSPLQAADGATEGGDADVSGDDIDRVPRAEAKSGQTDADSPVAVETQATTDADVETTVAKTEAAPAAEAAPASTPVEPRENATLTRIAAGRVDAQAAESSQETGPRVDASRFVNRVTGAFKAAQERGGEVRLRLSPPELGVLQVKLTVADGVLNASLETENAAARNVLLDNLPALRERLAEQEIRVEKFDVDVRQEGGGDTQDWAPGERRDSERRDAGREATGSEASPVNESARPINQPSTDGGINLVA